MKHRLSVGAVVVHSMLLWLVAPAAIHAEQAAPVNLVYGKTNITTSSPPQTGSNKMPYPAKNSTNPDPHFGLSPGAGSFVAVNLEGVFDLSRIRLFCWWGEVDRVYYDVAIAISVDGVNYREVARTPQLHATYAGWTIDFSSPEKAAFVKVLGGPNNKNGNFHVSELQVYGSPSQDVRRVEAGTDLSAVSDQPFTLTARLTGYNVAPATTNVWVQLEGPDAVTIDQPAQMTTTARASMPGRYRFFVSVALQSWSGFDDVVVDVLESTPPPPPPPPPDPPPPTPPPVPPDARSLTITPGRDFAADSWIWGLPADTPIDARSGVYIANLLRQIDTHYGVAGLNWKSFSPEICFVNDNTPTVTMKYSNPINPGSFPPAEERLRAVPWPEDGRCKPSAGTDNEVLIYWKRSDGTVSLLELWYVRPTGQRVQNSAGTLVDEFGVGWLGFERDIATADGTFPTEGGDWKSWNGIKWGVTATSVKLLGAIATIEELEHALQTGEGLGHMIGMAMPLTRGGGIWSWPAERSDGYDSSTDVLPQGAVLRLPSTWQPSDEPNMTPLARVLALTARDRGVVIVDTAGAVSFRAQNPGTHYPERNPYTAMGGILNCPNGVYQQACWEDTNHALKGFPFGKLQVLRLNLNK